jgi:lauroyl/myristoyl acyltransferase
MRERPPLPVFPARPPDTGWSAEGPELRGLAERLVAHAPELALRAVPPVVAALFWTARPAERAGVAANLSAISGVSVPSSGEGSLRTFVAFARSFTEGIAALSSRRDEVVLDIEGGDHLTRLAASGQGAVLLTAHTSSFEVAAAALVRTLHVPVVMAMRREKDEGGRRIQDALRTRAGLEIEHVDDGHLAAIRLAARLRTGAFVGVQVDRLPPGVRGLPVVLFGQPRELPLGPFALARATGAPLVCTFTRRTGFLEARIRAGVPVYVPRRATLDELASIAQQVADELEAWVREAPTEWLDWGGAR